MEQTNGRESRGALRRWRRGYDPRIWCDALRGNWRSRLSLAKCVRKVLSERFIRVDADNTGTDVQKVLRYAVDLGIREAKLVGFTGGRTDHWLWNLSMLKLFGDAMRLCIIDDYCEVRLGRGTVKMRAQVGQKNFPNAFRRRSCRHHDARSQVRSEWGIVGVGRARWYFQRSD